MKVKMVSKNLVKKGNKEAWHPYSLTYFKTLWPNISLCSCLEFIKKIVKAFLKPLS